MSLLRHMGVLSVPRGGGLPAGVGRWDLDGSLSAQEGTNLTLQSGTEQYVAGPDGVAQAHDFDGVTRFQSITAAARITGDVTVSLWARSGGHSGGFQTLAVCEGGSEIEPTNILWGLYLTDTDSRLAWFQENGAGVNADLTTTTVITPDIWYHLVGRRSGTTVSLWVNGAKVDENTLAAATGGTSSNVNMGTNGAGTSPYTGRLAQVRVFDEALSDVQIAQLYAETTVASPLEFGSPLVFMRDAGITEVSGAVASWDDEGSALLRFEAPDVPSRPDLVTIGSLSAAQCSASLSKYMRSTAQVTVGEPYIAWTAFRVDQWLANDRIWDISSSAFLAFISSGGNNLRWEDGASDLISTSTLADGDIVQVAVKIAATGGTSRMFVNGVEEASKAGTGVAPTLRAIGLGARDDGTNPGNVSKIGAAVFSFPSNVELDAFDMGALHTWGVHEIAKAA